MGSLGSARAFIVDEDGADDVFPVLAGGDVGVGAAGVVAGGPVVEQRGGHVVDEVELFGAAADVFGGGVDEVDADVVFGAGPAPGGEPVHARRCSCICARPSFVDAGEEDLLLLGVDDDAVAQVLVGAHEHVAVGVDGDPVEGGIDLRG